MSEVKRASHSKLEVRQVSQRGLPLTVVNRLWLYRSYHGRMGSPLKNTGAEMKSESQQSCSDLKLSRAGDTDLVCLPTTLNKLGCLATTSKNKLRNGSMVKLVITTACHAVITGSSPVRVAQCGVSLTVRIRACQARDGSSILLPRTSRKAKVNPCNLICTAPSHEGIKNTSMGLMISGVVA